MRIAPRVGSNGNRVCTRPPPFSIAIAAAASRSRSDRCVAAIVVLVSSTISIGISNGIRELIIRFRRITDPCPMRIPSSFAGYTRWIRRTSETTSIGSSTLVFCSKISSPTTATPGRSPGSIPIKSLEYNSLPVSFCNAKSTALSTESYASTATALSNGTDASSSSDVKITPTRRGISSSDDNDTYDSARRFNTEIRS